MSLAFGECVRCSNCGDYGWSKTHRCSPVFEYLQPDYDGNDWADCHTVHASDFQEAAEKSAEKADADEGEGPNNRTFHIRKQGEEEVQVFETEYEYRVDYSAHQKQGVPAA